MDIEIDKGSQFRFYSSNRNKKKSVVDSISINLKEYSTLNLNNANFKSLNKINVSKNTKIVYPIKYKEQ